MAFWTTATTKDGTDLLPYGPYRTIGEARVELARQAELIPAGATFGLEEANEEQYEENFPYLV
jgi:hypothetical protein